MNEQEPDTLERFGTAHLDAGKKLAEGYILLANFIKTRYEQSQRGQRNAEEAQQKEALNRALKEGGFEVNSDNREKLKAWSDAYEKNNEVQHEIAREISDINKQIDKLETISKLSPEEQQKRGFGKAEGLKDPTKEIDGLLGKKLDLGEKLDGLVDEAEKLEKGQGLEVLAIDKSIQKKLDKSTEIESEIEGLEVEKEKLQSPDVSQTSVTDPSKVEKQAQKIDGEIEGLGKDLTKLKGGKEVRPGSVFDSLVKSGYMEKGGLSFMNDKSVGLQTDQNKQNHSSKPKLK